MLIEVHRDSNKKVTTELKQEDEGVKTKSFAEGMQSDLLGDSFRYFELAVPVTQLMIASWLLL